MAEFYYEKEKEKILKYLDEFDKIKLDNNKNLDYLVIKLQETSLEMKEILDTINDLEKNDNIRKYVGNEFIRRDKISDLMPLFMYQFLNYSKSKDR